jgi:hypothetical protein
MSYELKYQATTSLRGVSDEAISVFVLKTETATPIKAWARSDGPIYYSLSTKSPDFFAEIRA